MGKRNYAKQGVQVRWDTKLTFTDNDSSLKAYDDEASDLIKDIKAADWSFDFDVQVDKKAKVSLARVKSIAYPQLNNGHVGESGHNWQWQLDVKSAGKGSKIRLYADNVTTKISNVEQLDEKITVGGDEYIVVTCDVTVKGKFTAGQKH